MITGRTSRMRRLARTSRTVVSVQESSALISGRIFKPCGILDEDPSPHGGKDLTDDRRVSGRRRVFLRGVRA